jgi:pimeloyl-ACP methyl ester carboxylesterase
MIIKRYFVPINGAQIHIRRVGEGPAVILLHPSPQSSTFNIPMALKLAAAGFTAIAVDLPGYGLSDPLVGGYPQGLSREHGLDPYLAPYVQLLDALGIEKAVFYGNATGAEFSHIFAYNHPERVAVAMLDTAGHNPDDEVDKLTDGYFPDTTPRRDGGHLLTYWDMVRFLSIFAPWQFTDTAHRLLVDQPPADKVHDKLIEYLRAGQNYAEAYRAAFYTAKGNLIGRVKVPATLTRWEGKPNIAEIDALIAYGLPANFTVLRPGPTMDQRLDASVEYLVKNYKTTGKATPPQPAQIDRASKKLQKMWIDVPGGQLLARVCMAGSGRPILGLHDPAGSSKRLESILSPFIGTRPVIAIDNPSSGESDKLLKREDITTEAYARFAIAALDTLNVKDVDIIGRYSGGQVAMEMSTQRPGLVKHIAQLGVMIFTDTERAEFLANYAPSIAPQWDGGHLIRAWSIIRDMNLFWPWYNRTKVGIVTRDAAIDGPTLHPRVEDLLKMGDAYQNAYAAAFTYPMAEKLRQLKVPCLAADVPGSGTYSRIAMAKAAAPHITTADLPDDIHSWAASFEAFFAG